MLARRGDRDALDALLEALQSPLTKMARRLAQGRGFERDDLEQAGRIAIFNACGAYDAGRGSFERYALAAAKNAMVDVHRQARRAAGRAQSLDGLETELEAAGLEQRVDAEDALAQLSRRQSTVARKLAWDGMTQREVAQDLRVSQRTVSRICQSCCAPLMRALSLQELDAAPALDDRRRVLGQPTRRMKQKSRPLQAFTAAA
jgi:RNA polymerase sigma factor (sigma-70 family)